MFKKTSWARLQNTLSPAIALLLLIWILPAKSEPISYHDPFRAIALQAPKPPDPPICCLKPLPSLEHAEDDLLLSFEEWKAKQHQTSENMSSSNAPGDGSNGTGNETGSSEGAIKLEDTTSLPPTASDDQPHVPIQEQPPSHSPHFHVPLVDRFNYASLDCSARVHKAHKGAKHPSNILSSKKDRYMLTPCKTNGEKQFVVIELCEDIRIDTVQLANFEFFSGVFKDFTVSVTKTPSEEWTDAGTYRAKNVRGVQSFHPPPSLRGFYRYLRIDFHSHYGSEYYCPVSLVRVYGLTHLEEWKWESWETESRAKMEASLKEPQTHQATETIDDSNTVVETLALVNASDYSHHEEKPATYIPASPINETGNEAAPSATMTTEEESSHSTDTYHSSPLTITRPPSYETFSSSSLSVSTPVSISSPPSPVTSLIQHPTESHKNATPSSLSSHNGTTISTSQTSIVVTRATTRTSSSIIVTASPLSTPHSFLPVPISGGESIYRMIMNRLASVEKNHTLYEQYMTQQQHIVREALKRMGEDIGRLEGLGKTQRQALDRTILEWEKQRKQWHIQHAQLLQTIDYLSDEIIMEKRLGVAQLCLLLAVLIFMGLTRGSRGPAFEDRRHWHSTLKSLSGDWRRPKLSESEDLQALKADRSVKLSNSAPGTSSALRAVDSISGLSSEGTEPMSSAPARLPLSKLDINTSIHQQQLKFNGDENFRPDHGRHIPIVRNNPETPTRARSRPASRSRSRTSSWQGRGVLFHSGAPVSRQGGEARISHGFYSGGGIINTPSKRSRVTGVYSPRSAFEPARTSAYASTNSRRPLPLQRSHSSYGPSGSFDQFPGQTWTGSGSAPKSARRWARMAHLHEVKGKRREDEPLPGVVENVGGGIGDGASGNTLVDRRGEDGKDVFMVAGQIADMVLQVQRASLHSDETDTNTDGWESASDVGVDSVEGGV